MRVLVIGSGGREHALVHSLVADPAVDSVLAAPGNPGIGAVAELHQVEATDPAAVAALAVEVGVDLVVVGPEAPLVAGVADAVRAKGIACFGPSAEAARLEGSKAYAKEVMAAAGVPTSRSYVCVSDDEVTAALREFGPPYVVKSDGLAAGKGVVVTDDEALARQHASECGQVVVEEFLDGPEVSLFAVTDGVTAMAMRPAQDFKRAYDHDEGLNTGGMGAYTPLPWAPDGLTAQVMSTVVQPTLAEMRRRGATFIGALYVGLALTSKGPRVIEFNARFGDPEIQVVLATLSTPLGGLLLAAATGKLAQHGELVWRDGAAVGVVVAAAGYPGPTRSGDVISGADADGVFQAGTALRADGALVSAGGRVLCCTATGADLTEARTRAYALVDQIHLDGSHHRSDIAQAAAEAASSDRAS